MTILAQLKNIQANARTNFDNENIQTLCRETLFRMLPEIIDYIKASGHTPFHFAKLWIEQEKAKEIAYWTSVIDNFPTYRVKPWWAFWR